MCFDPQNLINLLKIMAAQIPKQFTYQFFLHNRYKISQNQNFPSIEAICNNGFIKLYYLNCRVYWHVQNQFGHLTPDWKLHVSIAREDLPKAWSLVVGVFLSMRCKTGLKTYYLKECFNPVPGRQITIYILKYMDKYKKSCFANDFSFSRADQHSDAFWFQMVKNIQKVLSENDIKSNGLAEGDLKIGEYVSLRNQAFIQKNNESVYPPNESGWNPLAMQLPFDLDKMQKYLSQNDEQKEENQRNQTKTMRKILNLAKFTVPLAIISLSYFATKTKLNEV